MYLSVLGKRALVVIAFCGGLALIAGPGAASAPEPPQHHPSHVHAALHELKEARHELKESHPGNDFGGHKENALKAIDHAIHQLELLLPQHPHSKKK
jgi:hypothetical protein